MAKVRKNYMVFPATEAEIKQLVALEYGKDASQVVVRAVHAAVIETARTKPKPKAKS